MEYFEHPESRYKKILTREMSQTETKQDVDKDVLPMDFSGE